MVAVFRGILLVLVLFTCSQLTTSYHRQSKELSLCLKNNGESTLQTFWKDISQRCQHDPYQLMEFYDRLATTERIASSSSKSKCTDLLHKQLRNSLIESSATIFEEALLTNSFRNDLEIERLAKRIFQIDPRVSQAAFERFIDAVYLFTDKTNLASVLFDNKNGFFEQRVLSLLYLHWKFQARGDFDPRLLAQFASYFRSIKINVKFSLLSYEVRSRVHRAFGELPAALGNIYLGTPKIRLLNVGYWEYFYAPRENGPSETQRTPLTWIQDKNSTDNDGDLIVKFKDDDDESDPDDHDVGKIAFTSVYNGVPAFLYVEKDIAKPLFWLGSGIPETCWWLVYGYDDYIVLQNSATKHLLCATLEYDENRRYVTIERPSERGEESVTCRWLVTVVT